MKYFIKKHLLTLLCAIFFFVAGICFICSGLETIDIIIGILYIITSVIYAFDIYFYYKYKK